MKKLKILQKKTPKEKKLPKTKFFQKISQIKVLQKIKVLVETKLSKKKLAVILAAIALLVVAAVVAIIFIIKNSTEGEDDSYRSIQIYELEGTVTIEREEIGEIEAVENLYLESGDYISVDEDSYMCLKLDEDKYIMVEENTVFSIVAEGTMEDSETSIDIEEGAITNEIQNPLNDNSYYDVTTPNSVMAVRGTVFRVETSFDENGEVFTKVDTLEGTVQVSLILPDGTMEEEFVLVEGGKEVVIHMDDEITEYLSDPEEIDYDALPIQALNFFKAVMDNGTELEGMTQEEMETLIGKKAEELPKEESDNTEEPEEYEEEDTEEGTTKKNTEKESDDEDDEDNDDEEDDEDNDDEEDNNAGKNSETKQETYTVTFTYNGAVFGTQTVKKGQKATALKLAPAESGAWDFDFSKTITGDTTIVWK